MNLEANVKAQCAIKEIEKKRSEKRQNLFEAQDTIDERGEELMTDIDTWLKQCIRLTELFTIKWKLV